jgi:hypothetical protein
MGAEWKSFLGFHADALPKNGIGSNPPIDSSAIIPDLKSRSLNGFDEVKVFLTVDFTQDNIPNLKSRWIHRRNRTKLTRFNLSGHRVSARSKRDRFSRLEFFDVSECPTHWIAPRIDGLTTHRLIVSLLCREKFNRPNPPAPFPEREGGARDFPSLRIATRNHKPTCSPLLSGEGRGRG